MRKRSIAAVMAVIMTAIFLYDVAKIMKLTRQLPWKKIKNTQEGISDFYEYVNEDWEKEITLKDGEYVVSKLSMAKEIVEENLYNLIRFER